MDKEPKESLTATATAPESAPVPTDLVVENIYRVLVQIRDSLQHIEKQKALELRYKS